MIDVADLITLHLPAWLMVLFRLSGLFLLSPILGSASVPRYVKAMLVLVLSMAVYPMLLMNPGSTTFNSAVTLMGHGLSFWHLGPAAAAELMIGYIIGWVATLPLIGMQVGGMIIDQQMGLSFAQIVNPELGEASGVLGEFLFMLALALFAIVGGHHVMLAILVGSFDKVPLGGFVNMLDVAHMAIGLVTLTFELAIRVAAPLLCLMFLISVALGFIARTVPQMNILSIGFALRIVVGGVFLGATVIAAGYEVRVALETMFDTLMRMLTLPETWAAWPGAWGRGEVSFG